MDTTTVIAIAVPISLLAVIVLSASIYYINMYPESQVSRMCFPILCTISCLSLFNSNSDYVAYRGSNSSSARKRRTTSLV